VERAVRLGVSPPGTGIHIPAVARNRINNTNLTVLTYIPGWYSVVIAGLDLVDPAIHPRKTMDERVKPAHDGIAAFGVRVLLV
jgi:hypothetical protein